MHGFVARAVKIGHGGFPAVTVRGGTRPVSPPPPRVAAASAVSARCLLVLLLAACSSDDHVRAAPITTATLAAPAAATVAPTLARTPIEPGELGFAAGERLAFEVHARGATVGTVVLTATAGELRSRFATSAIASVVASIEHELVTTLAGSRPHSSRERVVIDGTGRELTTTLAGTTTHSLHTALGAIRAWARASAAAGYLDIVVGDRLVRLEVATPVVVDGVIRVDGEVAGLDAAAAVSVYLGERGRILRLELRGRGEQLTLTPSL
jgi:hypothetical protein